MAESSLCIPTCSKFTTFLQNLCKVFGLTLVIELKFWILPLMAFMSFFLPLFVILPAANEAKNKQFVTS